MVPITPAKPKERPTKPKPKAAAASESLAFTFASHQIEASRNKQSAAVLFTPYKHRPGVRRSEPQPSPTLQPAAR